MTLTPKETAKQLLDKFRNEFKWVEIDHNVDLYRDIRQCTLIAVELKLEGMIEECGDPITFWQQVKNEIKLL